MPQNQQTSSLGRGGGGGGRLVGWGGGGGESSLVHYTRSQHSPKVITEIVAHVKDSMCTSQRELGRYFWCKAKDRQYTTAG